MKVTMMLCDAAQSAEGKLNILGGGWSVTGPNPSPSAIALIIQVPWDQTNSKHRFQISLMTSDGDLVTVPTRQGDQPLRIGGEFEIGRPPGIKPGTPLDFVTAINIPPQPIAPGSRYEWRLEINGETQEDWQLAFTVRPPAENAGNQGS